jgi:hypothetical protein
MWQKKIVVMFALIVLVVGTYLYLFHFNNSKGLVFQKESLQNLLPRDALLRDFAQTTDGKTLMLYAEPGYKPENWDFYSCPGGVLGKAVVGKYHIALVQNGKIVNDVLIPGSYQDDGNVSLTVQNIKSNLLKVGEYPESEKNTLMDVKLLELRDLTGDGKVNEFNIFTTGGGCGFYDGLVGGYDEESDSVVLYSGWFPQFSPDGNGNYYYLFECGNHGNNTRYEAKYQFNQILKKFEKYWEKSTPCE